VEIRLAFARETDGSKARKEGTTMGILSFITGKHFDESDDQGYTGYCLGNPLEGDGSITVDDPNDPEFQRGLLAGIEYAAQKRAYASAHTSEEIDVLNQRNIEQWHRHK